MLLCSFKFLSRMNEMYYFYKNKNEWFHNDSWGYSFSHFTSNYLYHRRVVLRTIEEYNNSIYTCFPGPRCLRRKKKERESDAMEWISNALLEKSILSRLFHRQSKFHIHKDLFTGYQNSPILLRIGCCWSDSSGGFKPVGEHLPEVKYPTFRSEKYIK